MRVNLSAVEALPILVDGSKHASNINLKKG